MSHNTSLNRSNPSKLKEPWFFDVSFFGENFPRFAGLRFSTSKESGNSSSTATRGGRLAFVVAVRVLTKINVMIESASSPNPATRIHQSHFARNAAEASEGAFGGGGTSMGVTAASNLRPEAVCLTPLRRDQYAVSFLNRSVCFSISATRSTVAAMRSLLSFTGAHCAL